MAVTESAVREALQVVQDPDLHRDIVKLGFVQDVEINGPEVSFRLVLTTPACPAREDLERQCREALLALPGIDSVHIEVTAQVRKRDTAPEDLIPGVRQCLAIASGKGGVGKSTVAVNVAVALAQAGSRVGLLDADVYGPSAPQLMGLTGERPLTASGKIVPLERYGVKTMSLGFLLEEGQAVLWRGPMVAGTVRQLLGDVQWGDLDYLIVDLPPGTGDAPMSLAQLVPLTGVVVVSTPHTLAATIAGKATALFDRLETPVMGVIENMGEWRCPQCGTGGRLFSGIPGEALAETLGVPYLGSIPFDPATGAGEEVGTPILVGAASSPAAIAFREVASALAAQVSIAAHRAKADAPTWTPVEQESR
ncbi:MAG: Mrp/NBP35 family ATP-binding protein [Fimbriimonadaceae bacterium]